MKLFINFLILILLIFVKVQAQSDLSSNVETDNKSMTNKFPKGFISLSGGFAFPMGNFAATTNNTGSLGTVYSTPAGFAEFKNNFGLEGAYFFYKFIGIGGLFSLSSFNVNSSAIANGYLKDNNYDSATTQAKPYHTVSFLLGPYFTFPYKNFQFELRILTGITNTQTPTIYGTVINIPPPGQKIGSSMTFSQSSASASATGYQAGLGIKYVIIQKILISIRADYFTSKPNLTFNNVNRTSVGRIDTGYNQPIEGIAVTLGVGYQF